MNRLGAALLGLWLTLIGGCSLYVRVPMVRPADVDISGVRKIAVLGLPPSPEVPPQLGTELTGQISASLTRNGYFSVVERPDLAQLAAQLSIPVTAVAEGPSAARIGQELGVDALIVGSVDSLVIQDQPGVDVLDVQIPVVAPVMAPQPGVAVVLPPPAVVPAPPVVRPRHGHPRPAAPPPPPPAVAPAVIVEKRPFPFLMRTANLSMKLQLVRVRDGRLLYAQPLALTSSVKIYRGPEPLPAPGYVSAPIIDRVSTMRGLPEPEAFITAFAAEIPTRFVPHMVPTRYTKVIEFANDGDSDNKRGLKLAKADAWDLAQQAFSQGLARDPNNAAMHYNLGVVLEAVGDLGAAGQEYQRALSLDPGRTLFQRAYRSLQATLAEQEVLRRQTETPPQ